MTFGTPILRHCPSCRGLIRQRTLGSGNTLGARFWTDGKMEASELPQYPLLVRCPHCRALLWLLNAPEARGATGRSGEAAEAKDPLDPSEADYLEALHGGFATDRDKEKLMRLGAWHAVNDAVRRDNRTRAFSPAARANLEALFHLLDVRKPDDRILQAEIHRELGRFKEALQLLHGDFQKDQRRFVIRIRELVAQNDRRVAEVI